MSSGAAEHGAASLAKASLPGRQTSTPVLTSSDSKEAMQEWSAGTESSLR
jgi:hypothetical protein